MVTRGEVWLVTLDPNGRVVEMNSAAREILRPRTDVGLTPEETFGPNEFARALQYGSRPEV